MKLNQIKKSLKEVLILLSNASRASSLPTAELCATTIERNIESDQIGNRYWVIRENIQKIINCIAVHENGIISKHIDLGNIVKSSNIIEKFRGMNDRLDREQIDLGKEYEPYAENIIPYYLRIDGPNQWLPDEIILNFKEIILEFLHKMEAIAWELLEVISLGLSLPIDYFKVYFCERPLHHVKLIHYPATPAGEAGVNAHKDTGFLSLLVQHEKEASGLQVLAPDNIWIDINPPQGAIVVNVGEMLQAITGNYCIACIHRVIARNERYSSAYFHGPDLRTDIKMINIPKSFQEDVLRSTRHSDAKFMTKRKDLLQGKESISGTSAGNYGEQYWNYLVRSYPDSIRFHHPDYNELI